MPWMRDEREFQTTASKGFTLLYFTAFAIVALIGLLIGAVCTVAGVLHFHPLW